MMIDPQLKKEIVRNLHSAIDNDELDQNEVAYNLYVESLALVAHTLKQDVGTPTLSVKDKWNLIEFARESIARVTVLLKKREPPPTSVRDEPVPSAPPESVSDNTSLRGQLFHFEEANEEDKMLMCRYQRRLSIATSALEKQNLELELARHLVENDAITRNKLIQSSAWAMQTAQKKFNIEEKLRSGCLKESDLHRQQLLALSLHYNQGNGWLTQLGRVLSLYPNNDASTRELLDNMLTDENHPIKVALYSMQHNIMNLVQAPTSVEGSLPNTPRTMESIAKVIREDLSVILDVLKALFDPLNNDRNALIASEVVNHFYFSHLKTSIISFLRHEMSDVEARFAQRVETNNEVFCSLPENVESEAINKLHYLSTLHNPHEMLDCAVFIVKLLATSKFEHEHATSMGADDLLPRLCQVLVASGLVEICAEAAFMEMFIPSEKALGEEGYALTMLQSSIAHLTSDSSR